MTPHQPPTSVIRVSSWKCFFAQAGQRLPFTDLWKRTTSAPMFWWSSIRPTGPIWPHASQYAPDGGAAGALGGGGGAAAEGRGAAGVAAAGGPADEAGGGGAN